MQKKGGLTRHINQKHNEDSPMLAKSKIKV